MANKGTTDWNHAAIDRFLSRVDSAVKGRSKEMRLDIDSAQELSIAIATLLGNQSAKDEEIQALQRRLIELYQEIKTENAGAGEAAADDTVADGGGFK